MSHDRSPQHQTPGNTANLDDSSKQIARAQVVTRDAQTIADLLAALKGLLDDASEGSARGRAFDLLSRSAIETARAAIAKAERIA